MDGEVRENEGRMGFKGRLLEALDVLAMTLGCGEFRQKSRVGHTPRHWY